MQSMLYLALYTRTVPDWTVALTTLAVLALVPLCSSITLSAFRRHEAPIVSAVVITAAFFSFAVSFLSAIRIHVSFAGFAMALPAVAFVMAIANVRFHKRLAAHVALVAFDGDALPRSLLDRTKLTKITDPTADIADLDTVLIDPKHHHNAAWSPLLSRCYVSGVDVVSWTQFLEIREGRVHAPDFAVSHLAYSPSQMLYARSKRMLDILAVILTLPLTLPLGGLTALYIYLRDGGPIIFVQHRLGFGGRIFRLYKFRTMFKGTGGGATTSNDTRIIPGCTFIRRVRLDELPQLINVLIGDMSLIGPRPEARDLATWYRNEIPEWDFRNLVLPGITGWAQVRSGYTNGPDEAREKLAYDLYYIKHLSFDLDMQVLFRTIVTILFAKGAR